MGEKTLACLDCQKPIGVPVEYERVRCGRCKKAFGRFLMKDPAADSGRAFAYATAFEMTRDSDRNAADRIEAQWAIERRDAN